MNSDEEFGFKLYFIYHLANHQHRDTAGTCQRTISCTARPVKSGTGKLNNLLAVVPNGSCSTGVGAALECLPRL